MIITQNTWYQLPHKGIIVVLFGLAMNVASSQAAPSAYAAAVMNDLPVGYWRFGEALGTPMPAAADSSGHGNDGQYLGAIKLRQPGLHWGDAAALFNGGRVIVPVPDTAPLNQIRKITIEAKVKWLGPKNGIQQRILEKSTWVNNGEAQYGLSILDDGHVRVEVRTGLGATFDPVCDPLHHGTPGNIICANSAAGSVVAQGIETHIAATYDGSVIKIYLNGSLDSQTGSADRAGDIQPHTPDPTVPHEHYDLAIGNTSIKDRPFNGLIDDVALFDSALSAQQILDHFQAQSQSWTLYATGKGTGANLSALYIIDPNGLATRKFQFLDVAVNEGGLVYDPDPVTNPNKDTLLATGKDATSKEVLVAISLLDGKTKIRGYLSRGPNFPEVAFSGGGLAIEPNPPYRLYAVADDVSPPSPSSSIFLIDKGSFNTPSTGATLVKSLTPTGTHLYGLCISKTGAFYSNGFNTLHSGHSELFAVHLPSGVTTEIGLHGVTLGRGLNYSDLRFGEDGNLYSLGSTSGSTGGLYVVDPGGGTATLIGPPSTCTPCVQPGVDGSLAFVPPGLVPISQPTLDPSKTWHIPPPWPPWPDPWSEPLLAVSIAMNILLLALWLKKN